MARIVKDRVKETASTSGLAAFTLAGAVANFVSFASRMAIGDTTFYCADSGTQWEVGIGTYSAANTLTRSAVLDSSSAGAPVNFAAAPTVFMTVPAQMVQGAAGLVLPGPMFSAYQTAAISLPTGTFTKVLFQTKEFDNSNAYDAATSRFQPQIGGKYLIDAAVFMAAGNAGLLVTIYKNGAELKRGTQATSTTFNSHVSAVIDLNGTTDYVEIFAWQPSGASNTATGAQYTYFQGAILAGATPAAPVACSAFQSAAQSLPNASYTKIALQSKEFDTAAAFDVATSRFQPQTPGYYQVDGALGINGEAKVLHVTIYKNGAEFKRGLQMGGAYAASVAVVSALIYLNGTTDYLELWGYQGAGAAANTAAQYQCTYFQAMLIQPQAAIAIDKARISKTTAQNTAANAVAKVLFNNVTYDTGGLVDIANSRITPRKAGFYEAKWRASCSAATGARCFTSLQKNGAEASRGIDLTTPSNTTPSSCGADLVYCNGTTDYLEVGVFCTQTIGLEPFDFTTFLQVAGPF